MRFETSKYEFSHGKKPRGNGYWAFLFQMADGSEQVWFCPGPARPLTEAMTMVRANVPAGCRSVQVAP